MNPSSMIEDSPISFGNWSPMNYDNKIPVAQFHYVRPFRKFFKCPNRNYNQTGVDKPLYYAQQMGISTLVLQGFHE